MREKQLSVWLGAMCLVLVSVFLFGYAGAWKGTYAGAKTLAVYVEDVHENGWSEPLNARVDECEESLADDASLAEVDECLGEYGEANPKVIVALEAYDAAAKVLGAALLATDPSSKDQSAVVEAWADVLAAALDLVSLFPEGEKFVKQLKVIARKAGQ